jgi:hypothetical protein
MFDQVYLGFNSKRGPSANVWQDIPDTAWNDPNVAFGFFDDFTKGGLITSPTSAAALVGIPWCGSGSAGSTITKLAGKEGAVVLTEATDNEHNTFYSDSYIFKIGATTAPLAFETRIQVSTVTLNAHNFFVGLGDNVAKSVTVPLGAAAGALEDTGNYVGFHKVETEATATPYMDGVYKANGVAIAKVAEDMSGLAAATYIKLGMRFGTDNILRFYVNGVEQSGTKLVIDDLGTTFPSDVYLAPLFAQMLGATASTTMTIDWVACYQLCY